MVDENLVTSAQVQSLLDRASGMTGKAGDTRLKAIIRDLLEATMNVIVRHDVSEGEFWGAANYLAGASNEVGLIAPGLGLEHFMDLFLDAKDAETGREGGTPRTIEGPLYVAGAPLVEGDVNLTDDPDETQTLHMSGAVTGPDGESVRGAVLHVWHANSKGKYSHFDPAQKPFNNRRRIRLGDDGKYAFHSKLPNGYSVPPNGATDTLMRALGRHGNRPAHVHFFIEAPGYRTLTTQINFGDDPFARDDFAFGTREGLLPVPQRTGGHVEIEFNFQVQRASGDGDERFSSRLRASV